VIGWLQKYESGDLRKLIHKVQNGQSIYSRLIISPFTWRTVAPKILTSIPFEDVPEKENRIKARFAEAWSRFTQDFIEEKSNREYNSIKHRFRIRAGGFSLAVGRGDTWGVSAPREHMQPLEGSEFGSSFCH
jgi:hypothetical protein